YLTPRNIAWTHFPGRRPAGPSRSRQRPSWLPLEWGHAPTGSRSFHDSRWSDAGTRWTRRGPRWRLRAWWLAGAVLRRRVRRSYVRLDPAGGGVLVGQEDLRDVRRLVAELHRSVRQVSCGPQHAPEVRSLEDALRARVEQLLAGDRRRRHGRFSPEVRRWRRDPSSRQQPTVADAPRARPRRHPAHLAVPGARGTGQAAVRVRDHAAQLRTRRDAEQHQGSGPARL